MKALEMNGGPMPSPAVHFIAFSRAFSGQPSRTVIKTAINNEDMVHQLHMTTEDLDCLNGYLAGCLPSCLSVCSSGYILISLSPSSHTLNSYTRVYTTESSELFSFITWINTPSEANSLRFYDRILVASSSDFIKAPLLLMPNETLFLWDILFHRPTIYL